MKQLLLLPFFMLISIAFAYSQDVKFNKGIVTIDGKDCLKYDGSEMSGFSYYNMAGEELFFVDYKRGGSRNAMYWIITFVKDKTKMTNTSLMSRKDIIAKLVKNGALTNCDTNAEKLSTFILKYEEKMD